MNYTQAKEKHLSDFTHLVTVTQASVSHPVRKNCITHFKTRAL